MQDDKTLTTSINKETQIPNFMNNDLLLDQSKVLYEVPFD